MPVTKQDQVLVACPHCGHRQAEPRTAFSTLCKKCGRHLRLQEILNPAPRVAQQTPKKRHITCFECGAGLEVPVSAESTMCKWCSCYVDLHDYRIASPMAKNFKTKGTLLVELKGTIFNTESIAGDAVIKGKYHGKLMVEHSLTIYSTADVRGSLTTAHLVIPADNHFRWPGPLEVGSAEIAGELAGNLRARGTVVLKSTARLFGDVEAGALVTEAGAVVVGKMRIALKPDGQQARLF
jgi:cytoskeletal protein CcmA (bactofilin family)/DNA-directed RNA polymerase subunit RPC12/RpoP